MKKNKEVWVVFIIGVFTAFLFMKSFQYQGAVKCSLDEMIWVLGGLGIVLFPVIFYSLFNIKESKNNG